MVVIRAFGVVPVDLWVYRDGGRAVLDADPLYAGPLAHGLPFTYPPWAAILFTSLALLAPAAAKLVVLIGNCALAVLAAARTLSTLGRAPVALVLVAASAAVATEAVRTTIHIGQVNLLLLAVILWDLLRPDDRRSKGVGLGLVAGIKLTPMFFVLYLVATRRFRAAITAAGTFLATVVVGFSRSYRPIPPGSGSPGRSSTPAGCTRTPPHRRTSPCTASSYDWADRRPCG
ncbi:glycosyltransferase family 87 protein [Actinophytocola xanthii]|uniref:glycosyltransferase family 87 protein n=1 Tax=Actinophytocola xanthii TaxID=1912961 RepID=UPI001300D66F|nr:glycosyltransferase family 87 protein [Actinophytocola xanthii]